MTELDRLRTQRAALDRAIKIAEDNQAIDDARRAFKILGTDDSLPVRAILEQALAEWSASSQDRRTVAVPEFVGRLCAIIDAHLSSRPAR